MNIGQKVFLKKPGDAESGILLNVKCEGLNLCDSC